MSPENADYPVMIRCPGCSYLVPQAWDTCRRCGTMIRAQTPVVAAAAPAPLRVGGPPPPLPTLSPRSATPPRPSPTRPNPVDPPAPAPLDEFLPVASPTAPAAPAAPRDVEDLLPLIPAEVPITKQKYTLPKLDRKMALIGGGIVLLLAAVVFIWMQTKDDVHDALDSPVEAVRNAEKVGADSQLFTAQEVAQEVYADSGSYANVSPATLQKAEPGLVWVAGNQAAKPGEISVQVIDADTIVLVTSLPNGSCQAISQSNAGAVQIPATAPCMASTVDVPGTGGHFDDSGGGAPDTGAQP